MGLGIAWGLPLTIRELRRWRTRALHITAPPLQTTALLALDRKRGNTHGAALFAAIPSVRSRALLRLLVTYQVLWDFLDSLSETFAGLTTEDNLRLHLALVDALTPTGPIRDYYAGTAIADDDNYLRSLVEAVRDCCRALPAFHIVHPTLHREASRIAVQAINHAGTSAQVTSALEAWVAREYPQTPGVAWFEFAAAAGANIAIYALFALAAEPRCSDTCVVDTYRAYFPWAGALATMLDAFVDQFDDDAHGEHNYLSYYPSPGNATEELVRLVHRSLAKTHSLANAERHALVIASMVAMYLSRDSARTPLLSDATAHIAQAGGSLTTTLLPVLRLWRVTNNTRAS